MAAEGRDVVDIGDAGGGAVRTFAGPEAHALAAWNLLELLEWGVIRTSSGGPAATRMS